MTHRAVVLFSGGLDSMLAVRILQEQGLEVDALNIRTTFDCCKVPAAQAALELGIRQTVLSVGEDYIPLIRNPRYGHGKGFNPCVDCRIYMAKMAKRFMEQIDACCVATGEILGQRPMSQKRNDLDVVLRRSGLYGRLLRPLSAKLLEPTIPEQEGIIDREKLYDFSGRSRVPLLELAEQLGINEELIPTPSTGCALTEASFAPRVEDLLRHEPEAMSWEFELLNVGRHIRLDPKTKIVLGRNAQENAVLRALAIRDDAKDPILIEPENFTGPDAMLVGQTASRYLKLAGAILIRYSHRVDPTETANLSVRITQQNETTTDSIDPTAAERTDLSLKPIR